MGRTKNERKSVAYVTPIATPLLSGKELKKALSLLKGAAELAAAEQKKTILRGVVDVQKALRKEVKGIVFIATDIYPMDVISHLPVLCEDHKVPYVFLGSRKTLGKASGSKRMSAAVFLKYNELEKDYNSKLKKFAKGIK